MLDYFLEEILGQVSFVGTDGAKVYRSDDLIGVIPFDIEMISEEQILKVKKDGLVTQEIKMTPNPNYPQKIEVKLLNEEQTVLAAIPKTLKTSQSQEMKLITVLLLWAHPGVLKEGYQMRMRDWLRSPSHSILAQRK